jgi:hypothetical protein
MTVKLLSACKITNLYANAAIRIFLRQTVTQWQTVKSSDEYVQEMHRRNNKQRPNIPTLTATVE